MHGTRPISPMISSKKPGRPKPDWMLCEGTRINESSVSDEESVYRSCHQYTGLANRGKLFIFADYSYKDVDRFQTFYRVAKDSGRKLIRHAQDGALSPTAFPERSRAVQGDSLI